MQEESDMDKKFNRTILPLGKLSAADPKNKDGSSAVQPKGSHSGRRREFVSGVPQTKYDQRPSNGGFAGGGWSQKQKYIADRSRSRGGGASTGHVAVNSANQTGCATFDGHGNQVTVKEQVEVGSALRHGSKKQNLNHLLNFTYTSRALSDSGRRASDRGVANHKWTAVRKHTYNKEQFLQANCQFVVQEGADYSVYAGDPDLLVDWALVEQVRIPSFEVVTCPICLYEPTAGKITRCGHVYCWPCILHYLALSDKAWRKCPICYEAVHKQDLKSVEILSIPDVKVGDSITMKLMVRQRGSNTVVPVEKKQFYKPSCMLPDILNADERYAKILTATGDHVLMEIVGREERQLKSAFDSEEGTPEVCFIEEALKLLDERMESVLKQKAIGDELAAKMKQLIVLNKSEFDDHVTVTTTIQPMAEPRVYRDWFSDETIIDEPTPYPDGIKTVSEDQPFTGRARSSVMRAISESSTESSDSSPVHDDALIYPEGKIKPKTAEKSNGIKDYYFYQAEDGQHVYMHAINIRMLVHNFGDLEHCPDAITARIVEKEGTTMNEDLRHRLRYLGHLPLTCEFQVVELQLETPLLTPCTVKYFTDEVDRRKQRRSKKERDERRREKNIQIEENRKIGKYPGAKFRLDSRRQFPEYTNADILLPTLADSFRDEPDARSATPYSGNNSAAPSPVHFEEPVSRSWGSNPSFAQMLREGKIKERELATKADAATGAPASVYHRNLLSAEYESENDDVGIQLASNRYDLSLSDAIQAALNKENLANGNTDVESGKGKKKAKKSKKTLLFTTNMARNVH